MIWYIRGKPGTRKIRKYGIKEHKEQMEFDFETGAEPKFLNPVLTFLNGRFVFKNAPSSERMKLHRSDYWIPLSSQNKSDSGFLGVDDLDCYETPSLKAAAAFRRYGDRIAEKVFNRAFQERYRLPRELPLPPFLDPHQRDGVRWALSRKRSYLAHAPGAGKTCEAIVGACLAEGPGQALFIVPPSLTVNWEREILRFTEEMNFWGSVAVIPSTARQKEMNWGADFIVCPDSMLAKSWVYRKLRKIEKKFLAVDEASRFKDPFAERSIALYGGSFKERTFSGLYQDARHVVFLDGSPLLNRPMELWAPAFALCPESIDCLSQDDFGYRYCGPKINERGQYTFLHSSHEEELKKKLQKDFMHVVTEENLNHPERQRSILFMSEDVRSPEQKTWERRHLQSENLNDLSEGSSQGEMARFRRELGLRKIEGAVRYIEERVQEKKEKILVFAWHREVCTELAKRLGFALVLGGTGAPAREAIFKRFQKGDLPGIVGNIQAMGRGHNLQAADRVVFVEASWTDELNKQCEKRASRRGSEKEFVRCDYLVCPNSMDEKILRSVFTKEKRVKRIIG